MRKQIGVFLRSTGITEPADALKAAKSLGVDLIQVSRLPDRFYTPEGAREFERLLKDTGLRAVSVVVVFDGESYRDIDAIEATVGFRPAPLVEPRLAYARKCVDLAAALGVRSSRSTSACCRRTRPTRPTSAWCMRSPTSPAMPPDEGHHLAGNRAGDRRRARSLLDAVGVPGVGVNFDIANLVLYGTDDPPARLGGC